MIIDEKLEIKVVVATLDNHDNIVEIFYDWRNVTEDVTGHRFGFRVVDYTTGRTPSFFDDFYLTISDAMNDCRRIGLINDVLENSKKGHTISELSVMFNMDEGKVSKILDEYGS